MVNRRKLSENITQHNKHHSLLHKFVAKWQTCKSLEAVDSDVEFRHLHAFLADMIEICQHWTKFCQIYKATFSNITETNLQLFQIFNS